MRKSILFISTLLMLSACGNSQQNQSQTDTADSTAVESTPSATQPDTPDFHFDYQLVKGDDGDYASIIVKGYEGEENCTFQCRHDLVGTVSEESAADTRWVIDDEDINFDGQPDLQVFLWYFTRGQVAECYAAYVQTDKNKYEEVKQWEDLYNPQLHPDSKTVTESYRSDLNELTTKTYRWNPDNTLELIDTQTEPLFEEEEE